MQILNINLIEALDLYFKKKVWIDLEIDPLTNKLIIGGLVYVEAEKFYCVNFNYKDLKIVIQILGNAQWVCGHNILSFDLNWFYENTPYHLSIDGIIKNKAIDTLLLTNLVYPYQPSHSLLKLYKVNTTVNDPIYDCIESYQYYQQICKSWAEDLHPQIISWVKQKLPFLNFLPEVETEIPYQEYLTLIPNGNCHAFISWIESLKANDLNNLGAIVFANWLLHLEKPTCRRPSWLQDLSEYGEQFIKAEKLFWNNQQFDTINFDDESQYFFGNGYTLRPGQQKIIQSLVEAKSVPMGLLATGGGKSLTFQLPALVLSRYRRELTVIISPLKALMEDQIMGLQSIGHWGNRAACLISGQTEEEQSKILDGIWSGTIDLLYISPERLRTHTMQTLLSRRRPALWVVDEAHTISQWGTDFRPDFLRIGRLIANCYRGENITPPQVMLVTATAAPRVIQEIDNEIIKPLQHLLNIPLETVMLEEKQNVWRENIETVFIEIDRSQRLPEIRKILAEIFPNRRSDVIPSLDGVHESHPIVLIYVRSRSKTEEFSNELIKQGFLAKAYHAGMSSTDKQSVLECFKSHQLDVVVCTNAFGMGIDRASIHTVIHYSPPNNLESYLQEIGRAARKTGEKGRAILFWDKLDLDQLVQQNINSQIGGHKVLLECWQQVISKVLKKPASERWFTAQELQEYLSFEGEELVTQIRVILLALEKYNLLVEKEQLPALLSLKLIEAPLSTEGRAAELYKRLAPLTQQENTQLYLPETSVALGLSVKKLLNGIRQLVKLGCARWACEVRVRLSKRHSALQRKFKEKMQALEALEECWSMYPPEEVERVDIRSLDQWFVQHEKRVKARDIFYIFKHFKILKIKENKHSLRVTPLDKDLIHWVDWLKLAKKNMAELSDSLYLVLKYIEDLQEQTSQLLKIEELVDKESIEPEKFLQHLEYMQCFGWLNVSRLDDEAQKIFFIDLPNGSDSRQRLNSKVAYRYLEQHYQDKNRRLHILKHWLSSEFDLKKNIIGDYFNLHIEDVCKKYLPNPELAKQAHLEDFEKKILPAYLSTVQREIISDDQRRAMLVIAGPGSGKTTIIVHRVANLVMCCNIPAEKILILAYNRQAVFEVRQRLIKLIGIENTAQINIFTFHGLARNLTNISENQAPSNQDINYKYQWLLEQAVEYLKETPQFFQYILVDEFQDIDDVQYEMISHLAGLQSESNEEQDEDLTQQGYLVAVGDDDQNLYGFRGANIRHIQNFQKDFKIAHNDTFYLIDNYRSPTDIIELANTYIQDRLPQGDRLKTKEHSIQAVERMGRQEQENIRLVLTNQKLGLDSLRWVVNDLLNKKTQLNCDWSSFAILAKEWGELLVFQHCLNEARIPFQLLNQQNDLDITDSFIAKKIIKELEKRPALDIISGSVVAFLDQWVNAQCYNIQDMSFKRLKQRVAGEENKNLTCQQILDLLLLAPENGSKNVLTLTTYHSSKGCEYEHVYIYDQWRVKKKEDDHSNVRAMYVALTRAEKSLTLIQPKYQNNQKCFETQIRLYLKHLQPIEPEQVSPIHQITYFEPLGLSDIYLSCPQIITEDGRRRIEKFACDNQVRLKDDLSLKIKYWDKSSTTSIDILSEEYGLIGKLSKNCVSRLNRVPFNKLRIECVAMYILEYYQADLSFYEKAGYQGEAHSHNVVIPYLKITQALDS